MARRSRSRSLGSEKRRRSHERERGGRRGKDSERDRHRSQTRERKRDRSRSREKRERSRSREKRNNRSRSKEQRERSRSREKRERSRSREKRERSRSREKREKSRSREKRERSRGKRERRSRDRSYSREKRARERGRRSRSRQRGSYHSLKHSREEERGSKQRHRSRDRQRSRSRDRHRSRSRDRRRSRSRDRLRSRSRDRQRSRSRDRRRKSDRSHRSVSDGRRGQRSSRNRRSSNSDRRRRRDSFSSSSSSSSSSRDSSSDESSDDQHVKKDNRLSKDKKDKTDSSSSSSDEEGKGKTKHPSPKPELKEPQKTEETSKGKLSPESESEPEKKVSPEDDKLKTEKVETKSRSEELEDEKKQAGKAIQTKSPESEKQSGKTGSEMPSPSISLNNPESVVKDGQTHKIIDVLQEKATNKDQNSTEKPSEKSDIKSCESIDLVKKYSDDTEGSPGRLEKVSDENTENENNSTEKQEESINTIEGTEKKQALPHSPPSVKDTENIAGKSGESIIDPIEKDSPEFVNEAKIDELNKQMEKPSNQAKCNPEGQNESTVIAKDIDNVKIMDEKDAPTEEIDSRKEVDSRKVIVEKDTQEPDVNECDSINQQTTKFSEAKQDEIPVCVASKAIDKPDHKLPESGNEEEITLSEEQLKSPTTKPDDKKPEPEVSSSEEGEIKDDVDEDGSAGSGKNAENEERISSSERNKSPQNDVPEKHPLYVETVTGKLSKEENLAMFEKAGTSGLKQRSNEGTENSVDSEKRSKSHRKEKLRRGSDASEPKKKKKKKQRSRHSSSSSDSDHHDPKLKTHGKDADKKKKHDKDPLVRNYDSDETTEQELLRKKRQLEEQFQIEEEIRQRTKNLEREREAARTRKIKSTLQAENRNNAEKDQSSCPPEALISKDQRSRSRSRSHSQEKYMSAASEKEHKRGREEKRRRGEKRSRQQSSEEEEDFEQGQGSEEPQIGGRYWGDEERKDPQQQKMKQFKTSDTYWNKYADKLGIQIEDPRKGSERGRDRDGDRRREPWSEKQQRDDQDGFKRDRRRDDAAEKEKGDAVAKPLIKKPVIDPLSSRTGGAYIPPAKLKMMQAQITDKSSHAFQRLAWEALKKSINGLVNKVNVSNIGIIVRELLKENIVRGRGVLCKALMQAQAFSPTFTHVYAALVAIINSKFPQIGELLLKRLVIQFRRGVRRNDKNMCISSCRFIAHLVNQQVAHEVVALEVLTFLIEKAKNILDDSEIAVKSRHDSCELATSFLTECGEKLNEVSPKGMQMITETLRNVLHEGKLEQRVAYMLDVVLAKVKDGFKDHPAVTQELDLVEENEQFTHIVELDGKLEGDDVLNVFQHDPQYEQNEDKYKEIRSGILGDDSDESGSETGSESGSESDNEEEEEGSEAEGENKEKQTILDHTETNLDAFRRMVYLTIQSSLDVDECAHKLLKGEIKPGWETELCNMILDCCAQQRTYIKFYGLLAQRFCNINKVYQEPFQQIFKDAYDTCHRLETEKIRNVARLFAHLLFSDAISWEVLSHIHLNADETTSSSRVFVKILFQELAEFMSLARLNGRLREPSLAPAFEGLLPRDNPCNTRFAINFFTSCGLGGLTDDLREFLRTQPKPTAVVAPVQQQMSKTEENDSGSSSDSSSDSESSSSSSSDSSSSSSSDSSSSDTDTSSSDSDSSSDSSGSSESSSTDSNESSDDDDGKKKKLKKKLKKREAKEAEREKLSRKREQRSRSKAGRNRRSESEGEFSRQEESSELSERNRNERSARQERREERRESHPYRSRQDESSGRRKGNVSGEDIGSRRSDEEEQPDQRKREEKKERRRKHNSEDGRNQEQRREENGEREKRRRRHDSGEREAKKRRSHHEDAASERDDRKRAGREKVGHHSDDERKKDRKHRHR